jgi:hypothetical protein
MRRFIVLGVFCTALLVTLSGCFRNFLLENTETKETSDGIKTYVRFINNAEFPVDVFNDPQRTGRPLCSVDAGTESEPVEVNPNTFATYYLTYRMSFHGVLLTYDKEHLALSVPAGETTDGTIPRLSELTAAKKNEQFTEDVYLHVSNTSSSSLGLKRGGTSINLENGNGETLINGGREGTYKLPGTGQLGMASYSLYINNTTLVSWPGEVTSNDFERGHLYSFVFPAPGITFMGKWEMTINEILDEL